MLTLRPYQQEAVDAVAEAMADAEARPLVVLPTGAGKSLVIGEICRRLRAALPDDRVLVLTHVKELVEQDAKHIRARTSDADVGVVCAGLGENDATKPITVATVQTAANRGDVLTPIQWVLIDEAHRVPTSGDGQYRSVIDSLGARVIGLTATPYRMDGGWLTDGDIFNHIACDVPIRKLITEGFLSPVRSKSDPNILERVRELRVRRGDYDSAEAEALMVDDLDIMIADLLDRVLVEDRHSVLVFAAGIDHALQIAARLDSAGEGVECVFGETPSSERDDIIARFRAGSPRFLVNVGVLTTGFDAPGVDCVVLACPTKSASKYVQMIGRGTRLDPAKTDCLVLDYGGCIIEHGPIDAVDVKVEGRAQKGEEPHMICGECHEVIPLSSKACSACGHEIAREEKERFIETTASTRTVIGPEWIPVNEVYGYEHHKRGAAPGTAPTTLRLEYTTDEFDARSEWLCLNHPPGSFARKKAAEAWRTLMPGRPVPSTVVEALEVLRASPPEVDRILVEKDGRYWRIKKRVLKEREAA